MKNFKNKIVSAVLACAIMVVPVTLSSSNSVSAAQGAQTKISKKVKKESFSEKHPTLIKLLKITGITAGVLAAIVAAYYGGRFALDCWNPSRIEERAKDDAAKKELENIRKEKFELALQDKMTDRVKTLSDRETILEARVNSNSMLTNTATGIAGIGLLLTILKYGAKAIDKLGVIAKRIDYISFLRYAGENFSQMYQYVSDQFAATPKSLGKEEALENLDGIFESFHGQDKAALMLKSHLYDVVVAKDQAKWKGERYSRCDLFYLYGPSGVGKSFIAKRLPQILMQGSEPLIMSSSDVDREKKESVVDQLLRSEKQDSEHSGKIAPTKPLIKYLKNNPGGVVIFEEYDKVCTPALDEVFRTAMEQGTVNIDGEKIDCSGTTFIFTSNEDDVSMEGFEKTDTQKLDKQSISEGYTRVWHSKSFLNRIKKVKFNNLNAAEYAQIIKNHFDVVAAYWADENNAGIKLTIGDEVIKTLASEVEEINQGARPIDMWILPEIQMSLGEQYVKAADGYDSYKGKSFDVVYNSQIKQLSVVCKG